jgi:hypothetical protein
MSPAASLAESFDEPSITSNRPDRIEQADENNLRWRVASPVA